MNSPDPGGRIVVDIARPADRETGDYREWVSRLRSLVLSGYTEILVNLGAVPFPDSVLLGAIAYAFTTAKRHGATVKLLHPPPAFRELLRVTRLDQVLTTVDTVDDSTQRGN